MASSVQDRTKINSGNQREKPSLSSGQAISFCVQCKGLPMRIYIHMFLVLSTSFPYAPASLKFLLRLLYFPTSFLPMCPLSLLRLFNPEVNWLKIKDVVPLAVARANRWRGRATRNWDPCCALFCLTHQFFKMSIPRPSPLQLDTG